MKPLFVSTLLLIGLLAWPDRSLAIPVNVKMYHPAGSSSLYISISDPAGVSVVALALPGGQTWEAPLNSNGDGSEDEPAYLGETADQNDLLGLSPLFPAPLPILKTDTDPSVRPLGSLGLPVDLPQNLLVLLGGGLEIPPFVQPDVETFLGKVNLLANPDPDGDGVPVPGFLGVCEPTLGCGADLDGEGYTEANATFEFVGLPEADPRLLLLVALALLVALRRVLGLPSG